MPDPRFQKLADVLVQHSTRVQAGEKVLIEAIDIPEEFLVVLIDTICRAGGQPLCMTKHNRVLRQLYQNATVEQMELMAATERRQMEGVAAYIGIRGSHNVTELSDVPQEKLAIYQRTIWKTVHTEWRVPKTKWVVLRWPTPSFAQQAKMSTAGFEDFYFDVCTIDYKLLERAMQPLIERMDRARAVHIQGPGTDLRFSIEGIPVVGCSGDRNVPDGEAFTSPVRDSVNGTLRVTAPSLYHGVAYEGIELEFKDGKIVRATSNHTERMNQVLDSDEGARYVGEFSIAFNPRILHPMNDILFDEKIAGSFHFTPGQAYEEADNGNRSEIHWDLVTIQRPDYGGGTIHFDGELIREDGLFVPRELRGLNPESFATA